MPPQETETATPSSSGDATEDRWGEVADDLIRGAEEGDFDEDGYLIEHPEEEADPDDTDEETEGEGEEETEQKTDEGDPKAKEEAPAATEVKFTIGEGEEAREVTLPMTELKDMYTIFETVSGNADKMYDKLEEDITTKSDEFFGAVEAAHKEHQDIVKAYVTMLNHWFPTKPDRNNYKDDAVYNADLATYNQFSEEFGKALGAIRHSEEQQAEYGKKKIAAKKEIEYQKLVRRLPEWGTNWEGMTKEAAEILIGQFGFTKEELSGVTDHRFYRVFDRLIKYERAAKAAKETAAKNAKTDPKKGVKGAAKRSPPSKGQPARDADTGRFKKSIDALRANPRSEAAGMNAWTRLLRKNKIA